MTDQATDAVVRSEVTVGAPREVAFEVFTARMTDWWPLATHYIGAEPPVAEVLECRPGGEWYEQAADGTRCRHGHVSVWEPPARLVLVWEVSADWHRDGSVRTEVEVVFTEVDAATTHVALEHRGLERYGERAAEMREVYGSPGGWPGLLTRVTACAEAARPA
jgi:uncharacterized protein YndB with AHSA1/START domain